MADTKETSKQIPLRLPESLYNEAEKKAKGDGRSFNNWVVMLIDRAVKEDVK